MAQASPCCSCHRMRYFRTILRQKSPSRILPLCLYGSSSPLLCEEEAKELGSPAESLAGLPDACVLTALLFLRIQDALPFRRACRRMNLLLERSQNEY